MMAIAKALGLTGMTVALMLAGAPDAAAQWGPRVGIGYVVNAPTQYVGVSAHVLTRIFGGLGLYVDGKITRPTTENRDNFESAWTAQYVDDNFGDIPFSSKEEYLSLNGALMRPITPELIVYAGAGLTDRTVYVEYVDPLRERGTAGHYWVEDPDANALGANVIVGAFFRIARNVSLQFGVEAQPRGATVGASYAIPIGR